MQLFKYFSTEVVQIDSECPNLAVMQLFQCFPIEVVKLIQHGKFWPFCIFSTIPPPKWSELIQQWPNFGHFETFPIFSYQIVVQIDLQCPILSILQLFQYFPTKVV